MKRISLCLLLTTTCVRASSDPFIERASKNYQGVALELSEGLRFEGKNREQQPAQTVHLSFRDGILTNWWFIGHGWEAMHQHGGGLKLSDGGIAGDLNLRIYDVRGSLQLVADLDFSIGRNGDVFKGGFKAKVSGVVEREWAGTAKGAFSKPGDAFDPEASWRNYAGPEGTLSDTKSPPLIDGLEDSRPIWRSETVVPVSYGNAADDRYPHRAAGCRSGGGASSPVYADGVVFIAFYQPNMEIAPVPKPGYADKWFGKALDDYAKEKRLIPSEVTAILDHWRPIADDVVVAMDARTGATLWRTTWPQRSYNLQTHKHRGTFGVPLVADGKVFYPNLHGRLEVMDAKTGEPLWEFPKFEGAPDTKYRPAGPNSQSPLLIGEAVVWSVGDSTYGLSPMTGEVLWENEIEQSGRVHSLREVRLGDLSYALVVGGRDRENTHLRLVDPKDGEALWMEAVPNLGCYEGLFANTLAVAGDKLVAYRVKTPNPDPETGKIDKTKVTYHINAWSLSKEGMKHLWEDSALDPDEGPHLAIGGEIVYGVGRHLVRCLDLHSGKVLGEIEEGEFPQSDGRVTGAPGSNPLLLVAGDKLILSPEGQHGSHGFVLFEADPNKLTLLGDQTGKWIPPHASTTAYGRQPIVNPIVDGRMFFRGGNGIYCYDLRKQD